jgi:hypothetical protein
VIADSGVVEMDAWKGFREYALGADFQDVLQKMITSQSHMPLRGTLNNEKWLCRSGFQSRQLVTQGVGYGNPTYDAVATWIY